MLGQSGSPRAREREMAYRSIRTTTSSDSGSDRDLERLDRAVEGRGHQRERAARGERERLDLEAEVDAGLARVERAEQERPREVGELAGVDRAVEAGVDAVRDARAEVLAQPREPGANRRADLVREL